MTTAFWLCAVLCVVVIALKFLDWISERKETRQKKKLNVAERERQAAEKIAAIAFQAQLSILAEALKRSQGQTGPESNPFQQPDPTIIDGEVLGVRDEFWKPQWSE